MTDGVARSLSDDPDRRTLTRVDVILHAMAVERVVGQQAHDLAAVINGELVDWEVSNVVADQAQAPRVPSDTEIEAAARAHFEQEGEMRWLALFDENRDALRERMRAALVAAAHVRGDEQVAARRLGAER